VRYRSIYRAPLNFMSIVIDHISVRSILTRTSGYLRTVSSHSLQPYIGCSYGRTMCGSSCYVQHHPFLLKKRQWGDFLTVKDNAADVYRATVDRESKWARRRGSFSIFMSSTTDPFVPHDYKYSVSRAVLDAMISKPPDILIIQTHTHRVVRYFTLLKKLSTRCQVRIHISIESDINQLPGLPPPASSVDKRIAAAHFLRQHGLTVIVTMAPLLPIIDPENFIKRIAHVSDAIVIDHYIGGDGSKTGHRTKKTPLPNAINQIDSKANNLRYRNHIIRIAQNYKPGRVGYGVDGFAGRYLPMA